MGDFERTVADHLKRMMEHPQFATQAGLESALRLLAKWRSKLIDNTVVARHGVVIQGGPFAGMTFVDNVSEANLSPKLLGGYEAELRPTIEAIVAKRFDTIVDIGCADGYYAVGFAVRMPTTRIHAFDINPQARRSCTELAAKNGVADRVSVLGEFRGETFAQYGNSRTLIFIDAEGAEDELLRPDLYPALRELHVLAECHDVFKAGAAQRIADRFAPSHAVQRIEPQLHAPWLPSWFGKTSHLDQLLAIWEWRVGPTPWLYMTPLQTPPTPRTPDLPSTHRYPVVAGEASSW